MIKVRIGTRGSKLALWQAHLVANNLKKENVESEIVIIETKGDQILDRSIAKIGSKGVFTEELESQLRSGKIDIAVHSAKDMQSKVDSDLELIAFTEREITNDVLISTNPDFVIEKNSTIGTSSTRRRAQLRHMYPGLNLVEMRGNLQTRLEKLKSGVADGIILAYAGVHRMNMENYIVKQFPLSELTPAAGQGSVVIQSSIYLDEEIKYLVSNTNNHPKTNYCVSAERAFLSELEGGCSVPVYCHGTIENGKLLLVGGVISLDGKTKIESSQQGNIDDYKEIGIKLAREIISRGGQTLLLNIKAELN